MRIPRNPERVRGSVLRVCLSLGLTLFACGRGSRHDPAPLSAKHARPEGSGGDSATAMEAAPVRGTHTEMRGLALRILDGVVMHVAYLSGTAVPLRSGDPVVLDDPRSYRIEIDAAESRLGYADLARLLNDHVFAYDGAPIENLRAVREHDAGEEVRLELKGNLASLAGVPFEIEGVPEATPDGRIRIRARSIQSMGISIGGLMDLLDLETEDVADFKEARGVEVDGNDMILDPSRLLPPPRASGRVTHVALDPDGMILRFGGKPPPISGRPAGGFLHYRGGTVRLGRMTMTDADIQILDARPADPFDFYPAEMNRQISAGYVKVQPSGGLKIFAPDFGEIGALTDLHPSVP